MLVSYKYISIVLVSYMYKYINIVLVSYKYSVSVLWVQYFQPAR